MMPGSKITGFMRSTVKMTGKVGSYMKIQDFCDMNKFEQIMKNWANSTGLATVAVDADENTSVTVIILRSSVLI